MKKIAGERKDIAFYLKLFPLAMHGPVSMARAREIECKHSLALLEESFAGKALPKPECPAPEIDQNIKLAKDLGISGTPTIILPDGVMVMGARPEKELLSLIDQAAKEMHKKKPAGKGTTGKK